MVTSGSRKQNGKAVKQFLMLWNGRPSQWCDVTTCLHLIGSHSSVHRINQHVFTSGNLRNEGSWMCADTVCLMSASLPDLKIKPSCVVTDYQREHFLYFTCRIIFHNFRRLREPLGYSEIRFGDEVIWLWAQTLMRTCETAARGERTDGHPSLKDPFLCQFTVWFASSEGNWYQMKCFYLGDLTVRPSCLCCLTKLFTFLNTFSRLCFWFLSYLCLLLVFLQISDLNRRVSAIENLLNHLEQNVISTYDQVNPSNHTTQLPNNHPHHLHHHHNHQTSVKLPLTCSDPERKGR